MQDQPWVFTTATNTYMLLIHSYICAFKHIPYKMKIWHRIYFGGLANYKNLLLPNACKYNSIRQYKICQSLKKD